MNNQIIRYVAIIAPVFAFCVALSTLLGRIYFLRHFETLGIPASDVHHNIIDYSVISPGVTIFGVGALIVTAVFVWWRSQAELKANWRLVVSMGSGRGNRNSNQHRLPRPVGT